MTELRKKGLVVFLYALLTLHFVAQKWFTYYVAFEKIDSGQYINWREQAIFLSLSLVVILLLTIIFGSLLVMILNRHRCNVEFSTLVGCVIGIIIGGCLMLFLVMIRQDVAGIKTILITTGSGFALGVYNGIRNEIEDDEGVC